jgi:hypothetical protein
MIELDNYTIGILILFAIIAIMIITSKIYNPYNTSTISNSQYKINPKIIKKQPINLIETNKLTQMQIMNMKYENIVDDLVDYNNKPTGLFVIP